MDREEAERKVLAFRAKDYVPKAHPSYLPPLQEGSVFIQPAGWPEGFFCHRVLRSEGMVFRYSFQGKQEINRQDFIELVRVATGRAPLDVNLICQAAEVLVGVAFR